MKIYKITEASKYLGVSINKVDMTTDERRKIIARAAKIKMSPEEAESQRRSFAYGNTKIGNKYVTKEMIDRAALDIDAEKV